MKKSGNSVENQKNHRDSNKVKPVINCQKSRVGRKESTFNS